MFEMSQFKKWPRTTKEYLYRDFFLSFGAIKEVFYSHQTKKRRFKKFVIFQKSTVYFLKISQIAS